MFYRFTTQKHSNNWCRIGNLPNDMWACVVYVQNEHTHHTRIYFMP